VAKRNATPKNTAIIVNRKNGVIICTAHATGNCHDFKIYKDSIVGMLFVSLYWFKGAGGF